MNRVECDWELILGIVMIIIIITIIWAIRELPYDGWSEYEGYYQKVRILDTHDGELKVRRWGYYLNILGQKIRTDEILWISQRDFIPIPKYQDIKDILNTKRSER